MKNIEGGSRQFKDIEAENEYFQNPELYSFVPEANPFIQKAKEAAIKHSLTTVFPIGIVAVRDGHVIAEAGNGNGYHERNLETQGHRKGCIRRYISDQMEKEGKPKFKSGEGFELCPGCHPDSHAEANLVKTGIDLQDSEVYMYGHYWCCRPCMEKMEKAGVKNVYLPDTYEKFKSKEEVAKWAEVVKEERAKFPSSN